MKSLTFFLNETLYELEVTSLSRKGCFEVKVKTSGQSDCFLVEIGGSTEGETTAIVDERRYRFVYRAEAEKIWLWTPEKALQLQKKLLHEPKAREGQQDAVVSPMTGKITKVFVRKGDLVRKDQPLLVLEAMKMETVLRAPRKCTVEECLVEEGMLVQQGKTLVRLKKFS